MEALTELCVLVRREVDSVTPIFDPAVAPEATVDAIKEMIAGVEFSKLRNRILTDKDRAAVERIRDAVTCIEADRRDFLAVAREVSSTRNAAAQGISPPVEKTWIFEKLEIAGLIRLRLLLDLRPFE